MNKNEFDEKYIQKLPDGWAVRIACLSWTTAKGDVTPVMFRCMGADQSEISIRDIMVRKVDKRPNGYRYNEYVCEASVNGVLRPFRLRHTPVENEWLLILR